MVALAFARGSGRAFEDMIDLEDLVHVPWQDLSGLERRDYAAPIESAPCFGGAKRVFLVTSECEAI